MRIEKHTWIRVEMPAEDSRLEMLSSFVFGWDALCAAHTLSWVFMIVEPTIRPLSRYICCIFLAISLSFNLHIRGGRYTKCILIHNGIVENTKKCARTHCFVIAYSVIISSPVRNQNEWYWQNDSWAISSYIYDNWRRSFKSNTTIRQKDFDWC